MLDKKRKAIVRSTYGDTDFFDIVAEVLQGNNLVPYLFIFYLEYALQVSIDLIKGNDFVCEKARSRQ